MKLGSNQALCCSPKKLEIIGTGGFDVKVGKPEHWHNLYSCPACNKVYYELADFGEVVHLFYSKKGTRAYQIENRNCKDDLLNREIVKMLQITLFKPLRGGLKFGIKTLDGYRAVWFETPSETLDDITYEDMLKWGFNNFDKYDLSLIKDMYKRKYLKLKSSGKL